MGLNRPVVAIFAVVGAAMLAIGGLWYLSADDDAAPGSLTESTAATLGGPILMATGAFFLVMLTFMWLYVRRRQHRASNGVPAMARLISSRDTGMLVNNQPRLELELEIRPEGGGLQPYRLSTKRVVGYGSLGSMQPGAVFPISVDPDRPDKFEFIDHEQYAALGGGKPGRSGPGDISVDDIQRMLGGAIAPDALANATIVRDGEVIQQGRPSIEHRPGDDRIEQLERLAALHRSGALTDEEFADEKRRLLGG
jgi:hypothetical protein